MNGAEQIKNVPEEVEQAVAKGVEKLKKIKQHGEENFAALSWMRTPVRERILSAACQLNLAIQQNNVDAQGNGDGNTFQMANVSHLEFLGLRKHESYQHHEDQGIVHDIEAETVPAELSGHLTREGSGSAVVISETRQQCIARRIEMSV